jgi:lipid-binding SYLF domain-containing protein
MGQVASKCGSQGPALIPAQAEAGGRAGGQAGIESADLLRVFQSSLSVELSLRHIHQGGAVCDATLNQHLQREEG